MGAYTKSRWSNLNSMSHELQFKLHVLSQEGFMVQEDLSNINIYNIHFTKL